MAGNFLLDRIADSAETVRKNGTAVFLDFFEPVVQYAVEREIARIPDCDAAFFGGHEYCERRMLAVFLKGREPAQQEYPIQVIQTRMSGAAHPDVLGAILSAGIERDGVGDIDIANSHVQVFLKRPLGPFIIENVTRIANIPVVFEEAGTVFVKEPSFIETDVIVSSMRIDTVIHAAYRLSRSEAGEFLKADRVKVNFSPILKPSYNLKERDVVSVRSKGRFIVDAVLGSTKKGNIRLRLKKYA